MTTNYRSVWEAVYGEIPTDAFNRSFEIHHIDGNRDNNEISNLQCVSIDEHYDIHFQQGDFGACHLIAKRKATSSRELSQIVSDLNKRRIGEKNPFFGKKHTQDVKDRISKQMSGKNHPFFGKKRPDFAKKVSAALKGKVRSPEHCANIRKAKIGKATKQWKYNISFDGQTFEIINLKQFCRDHLLKYHKLRLGIECDGYKLLL
jgi:hypothetical protein